MLNMVNLGYKEAASLLTKKLDEILEKNTDISKPLKAMILGGYALQALCDSYGTKIERKTNDIDLYTSDAKALISDDVAVSPTGARIQLTDDFHGEMFDWISGMDHEKDLEKKILNGIETGKFTEIETDSKNIVLYLPSPEVFVANKLFAYRGDKSRGKDLKDVAVLTELIDPIGLRKIHDIIKHYNLQEEYNLSMKYKDILKK
jgi:hypothetical protein